MKKRDRNNMFDALMRLEEEDSKGAKKTSARTSSSLSSMTMTNKPSSPEAISRAALSQSQIYSHLVEVRILLQRAMIPMQQQQQKKKNGDEEQDDVNEREKSVAVKECDRLLDMLIQARKKLVLNDGKEALSSPRKKRRKDLVEEEDYDDDEAGDSDSDTSQVKKEDNHDDEDEDDSDDDHDDVEKDNVIHNDDDDDDDEMQRDYEICREDWKRVLNAHHHRVRLHSGLTAKAEKSFRVLDSTFWQQVQSIVQHEQLQQQQRQQQSDDDENNRSIMYDDTKIYQQLLKDFCSQKTSSATTEADHIQAARERLQQQGKKKKNQQSNVDRKASKGRKVRYAIHPKLVHFTFPVSRSGGGSGGGVGIRPDNSSSNTLDEDEWFRSLFGGAGTIPTNFQ